jgi:hypothetical protein
MVTQLCAMVRHICDVQGASVTHHAAAADEKSVRGGGIWKDPITVSVSRVSISACRPGEKPLIEKPKEPKCRRNPGEFEIA